MGLRGPGARPKKTTATRPRRVQTWNAKVSREPTALSAPSTVSASRAAHSQVHPFTLRQWQQAIVREGMRRISAAHASFALDC